MAPNQRHHRHHDPSSIMTIAALSRAKRPLVYLPEFRNLQKQVENLMEDNEDQVELERQSQKTFEYLCSQVKAIKHAFGMLSEVMVEEVQGLKSTVAEQNQVIKDLKAEARVTRAESGRVVEWVRKAGKDLAAVQEAVEKSVGSEAGYVRKVASKQDRALGEISSQLQGLTGAMETLRRGTGEQRVEDLEILQSALETSQRAQRRSEQRSAELERAVQLLSAKMSEQQKEHDALKASLTDTVEVLKNALAVGVVGPAGHYAQA